MPSDISHTVIPQALSLSSLSSTFRLSVAGAIQDQWASVENAKLTPFQEKTTGFKLVKRKHRGNKTQSKFWKFYHAYERQDNRPTKLDTDKDFAVVTFVELMLWEYRDR
jgi:hypothetical protein